MSANENPAPSARAAFSTSARGECSSLDKAYPSCSTPNGYPFAAGQETAPRRAYRNWPRGTQSPTVIDARRGGRSEMPRTLEEAAAVPGGKVGQRTVELSSTVPASPASIAL